MAKPKLSKLVIPVFGPTKPSLQIKPLILSQVNSPPHGVGSSIISPKLNINVKNRLQYKNFCDQLTKVKQKLKIYFIKYKYKNNCFKIFKVFLLKN